MRKDEIRTELLNEHTTLRRGSDETGYEDITGDEYQAIIESWAEAAYAKELEAQAAEAQAEAKAALLNRLGISADEAKLLLG
jgi:hypothetical protein